MTLTRDELHSQLALLLVQTQPSTTILQNCIDLIQREQLGLTKYGTTLPDAKLSRNALLQHAREEALDLANYLLAEQQREDT